MTKIIATTSWGEADNLVLVTAQGELLLVEGDIHSNTAGIAVAYVTPVKLYDANTRKPVEAPRPAPGDSIEAAYITGKDRNKTVWEKHTVVFVGTTHFQHTTTEKTLATKAYADENTHWRWPTEIA